MRGKTFILMFAFVFISVLIVMGPSAASGGSERIDAGSQDQPPADPASEKIYKDRCEICHDHPVDRIPPRALIARRATEGVIKALTTGAMKSQAADLSAAQIRALAIYVTGKQPGATQAVDPGANMCQGTPPPINLNAPSWNGWGRDLDNSRYQPKPGLKAEDVPRLKVKWAWAHPGPMATGQPTIIGDRLFVTTEVGQIYSLNAQTGCTYWTVKVGPGVRAAMSVGAMPSGSKAKFAVYFGGEKSTIHALDAATGELLWKTQLEEHPLARITGAPVLHKDRIYVPLSSVEEGAGRNNKYECCKFRGSLAALDAYTGKIIWQTFTIAEEPKPFKLNSAGTQMYGPAGAAIWSAPTLDLKRKLIYVGTGNSYTDVPTNANDAIMAFEMETGKIKWVNQVTKKDSFLVGCRDGGVGNCPQENGPDYDFGSSPILRTLPGGKQILLGGQKSGVLWAFDPDNNGKVLWQVKVGNGGALGGIEWGFTADNENVYVPMADVSGTARKPGITALKIATGDQIWMVPAPPAKCTWGTTRCNNSQSAAATLIPGIVFSGTSDGHLRAYAVKDGTIVWDFDTAGAPYDAVNGAIAKGGTLDGSGPTIANGILYTNSGYGRIVGYAGNVLLAFSVDGK